MNFNKQQEKVINTIEGNIAVIATAGSGKCIRGDSYIFTNRGMYQIQEIPNIFSINNNDFLTLPSSISNGFSPLRINSIVAAGVKLRNNLCTSISTSLIFIIFYHLL